MRFVHLFAVLLFAAPLFPAAVSGTTVIDRAGNVWQTGQTNFVQTTETAFQKTAVSNVCATEDLSPFQGPTPVYCQHAYLIKDDPSGNVVYATFGSPVGNNELVVFFISASKVRLQRELHLASVRRRSSQQFPTGGKEVVKRLRKRAILTISQPSAPMRRLYATERPFVTLL
jgi:hypothetical protein